MAPLFIPCTDLSRVYSPLAQGRGPCLPGVQSRVIPFTRPSRPLGRLVKPRPLPGAVAPELVRTLIPSAVSRNGAEQHQIDHSEAQADYQQGTLTVHGGERAGRPRVSGGLVSGGFVCGGVDGARMHLLLRIMALVDM